MTVLLSDSQILDLANGTLKRMDAPRFSQIATRLQVYEVLSRWLKKDKVVISSGIGMSDQLMVRTGGSARHAPISAADDVRIVDLMAKIEVPWAHLRANWGFYRQELLMNRGKELVYKILSPREGGAMIDIADALEVGAWRAALPGDVAMPLGVPFWVVKSATAGFNGGNPAGFSTCGGIDASAVANHRNYTFSFSAYSRSDLFKKWATAHRLTRWQSPVNIPDCRSGNGSRYRYYANTVTVGNIEEYADTRNDNLGWDVAGESVKSDRSSDVGYFDGIITYKRHPIVHVPQLDADTSEPIYGLDHDSFRTTILEGDNLRRSDAMILLPNHNALGVFIDLSYQFACLERRNQMVAYKA